VSLDAANLLLDTGILIHLCRGGEAGSRLQARYGLRDRRLVPWTSVICVGEVLAMARRNGWGDSHMKVLRDLLAHLVVLNLRPGVILDAYAELDAHLSLIGRRMGQQNDLWIAATARATGATILTTDRDFDVLHPDLVQREWVDPVTLKP
jgi:tRNA(fMet)-specific endonuclease VapC